MQSSLHRCFRCKKRLPARVVRVGSHAFHPECFICDGCQKPLQGQYYEKAGRYYDKDCYQRRFLPRCTSCKKPISGRYFKSEEGPYHEDCYRQKEALVCTICQKNIDGSYVKGFGGQKAHTQHNTEKTQCCHVCASLFAPSLNGGKPLNDGRALCGSCSQSEISTDAEMHQAKLDVLKLLNTVGFEYIPEYLRIKKAEDQPLLNARMRASATGNIHGVTRSKQRQIPGYGWITEHEIEIISALPRLAFMGVMAHELLHVWLHEHHIKGLEAAEVEGFCNLAAALIYQNSKSPLAEVLLQRMQEDPDPVYGEGYRTMQKHLKALGWAELIRTIEAEKPLPKVERPPTSPVKKPAPLSKGQGALNKQQEQEKKQTQPPQAKRQVDLNASKRLEEIKARLRKEAGIQSNSAPSKKRGLKKLGKKKK